MMSSSDPGGEVITASCTLLAASHMSDSTCPSTPSAVQRITLHTSSQKIVVPVAAVCASPDKQSAVDGGVSAVSTTAASGLGDKPTEAADAASHKPVAQKTGSVNIVTRRVRFQAKPNISRNARTR